MYANFTEETCTGTSATLTLAGATTDNLAFSLSYADGDLVAYAVEDSGGSIKITGVGTYNSAGNTITRSDTYNYNGTVVDKNPSTNITLSGGTHTIRCDIVGDQLTTANLKFDGNSYSFFLNFFIPNNIVSEFPKGRGNDDAPFNLVYQPYAQTIYKLGIEITTADAASTNNLAAIYTSNRDLMPGNLLVSTSHLSGAATGIVVETLLAPLYMPAGWYYYTTKSDSSSLRTRGGQANGFVSPIGMYGLNRICIIRRQIVGSYPSSAPTTNWTAENNGFSTPIFEFS
jgi:hypothetical protein